MVELPLPRLGRADKGRRLDHIWVTSDLADNREGGAVTVARHVRAWEKPSDHVPVTVELEL